jgi:hypothetical protein
MKAAEEEVSTVVALHELCKPTGHDTSLLERMGEVIRDGDLHCYLLGATSRGAAGFTSSMRLRRQGRESATYNPHSAQTGFLQCIHFVQRDRVILRRRFLEDHLCSTCGERIARRRLRQAHAGQFDTFTKNPPTFARRATADIRASGPDSANIMAPLQVCVGVPAYRGRCLARSPARPEIHPAPRAPD